MSRRQKAPKGICISKRKCLDTSSMRQSVKIQVEQVAVNSGVYYNKIKNESSELRVRGKARASLRETKHQTIMLDDSCFWDYCSSICLPISCYVRHWRKQSKLCTCCIIPVVVCPVGIFPGSAYHSETGIALSSSDGSLDTDMDDSSDI